MQWRRVMVGGKITPRKRGGATGPGKRWGHTCNAVEDGRLIYVFGGYGKYDCQTKDVHVFDAVKETWSKPVLKGTPPSPRDSHTSTTVGDKIFIFGGTDGHKPLDDLYVLDTVSNTWSKPAVHGEGPTAREGHGAAIIGHDLFIFGGCGRSSTNSEQYFNDLYILNTETFQWRKVSTTGQSPIPRDSHMSSSYKNKFIVVGGTDASNSCLGDVHTLDVDSLAWKELKTTGTKLAPRAAHTTVTIGRHLFVFGGFADEHKIFDDVYVLDLETGIWTMEKTTGSGPSARFSLAGDCVNLEKGIILLYGGCNEGLEALDDMYYLDTGLRLERNPADQTPEKFSFKKELKRRRQEHLALTMLGKEKAIDSQKAIIPAPLPESINEIVANIFNKDSKEKMEMLSKQPPSPSPQTYVSRSPFFDVKPVAERIFEAKINDVFHYGYTIETSIEGKAFRGLLFSYKPEFSHAAHLYLTRKKLAAEQAAVKSHNTANENSPYIEQLDRRVCFPVSAEKCYLSLAEQGHSKLSEIMPPEQYQDQLT